MNKPSMTYLCKMTKYFRSSVLDGERLSPNVNALFQAVKPPQKSNISKDKPFSLDASVWSQGKIPQDFTAVIFKAMKVNDKIKEVRLILMPRIDLNSVSYGQNLGKQSPIMAPLVVEVLLERSGLLKPSNVPPFVPREWMAPNHSEQIPFAELDMLDEFVTLNPYNVSSWWDLVTYCEKLLTALVENKADIEDGDYHDAIWQPSIHPDYQLKQGLSLAMLEPPIRAGFHIIKILDAIIKGTKPGKLYERLISKSDLTKSDYQELSNSLSHSKHHTGQMTGEFPLSEKQRNAIHYLSELNDGDMLVVNGPPGTGKTTLIRSVVANLWVQAALLGDEVDPPIIVATSSNNQAVTNILESFSSVDEAGIDETLKGRWLPTLSSYGLYACGNNKANQDNKYPYATKKGEGLMAGVETIEYVKAAEIHFLMSFNRWFNPKSKPIKKIVTAIEKLQKALVQISQIQLSIIDSYEQLAKAESQCQNDYGDEHKLMKFIRDSLKQKIEIETKIQALDSALQKFLKCWQQRSFLHILFSFLPSIKQQWHLQNEVLARELKMPITDTSDKGVREAYRIAMDCLNVDLKFLEKTLSHANGVYEKLSKFRELLTQKVDQAGLTLDIQQLTSYKLMNELDISLRFKMFKLATHYWEARWLLESTGVSENIRSPAQLLQRHRRYAKLTPCLVATFNMLPNFFEVSERDGDGWKSTPLIECIDLLIIDEAGQALPHVAAASFAVAKKALLVGDVDQIEPVWSLSTGIDRANLKKIDLLNKQLTYENFWLPSSLSASSGNLMKVAHRQNSLHQFIDLEPGLYLTEHRRCYDSIIKYCNKLVYHGHLEQMRGDPDIALDFPMMGFVHHESDSNTLGSSRINRQEAIAIVKWIIVNRERLSFEGELSATISIITPFSAQAKVIRDVLKQNKLLMIRVGTVHTFQGAECPIVLFSSVYGSNDSSGSKFYDRGRNMLNVAVSRAKNSFIVFGHRRVFGSADKTSPSGLLRSYLSEYKAREESPEEIV